MSEQTSSHDSHPQLIDRFLAHSEPKTLLSDRDYGHMCGIQDLVQDYISISGQGEAGATEVATEISQALNWPLFTRQQLELIAPHDGYRMRLRACLDHHTSRLVTKRLGQLKSLDDFGRALAEVALCLSVQSEVVLLNCGASLTLPRTAGVNVRLTASKQYRANRLATIGDIDSSLALEQIQWIDAERRESIRTHFGADLDTLDHYDLVINREHFPVCLIVRDIVEVMKAKREGSRFRQVPQHGRSIAAGGYVELTHS